MVPHNATTGHRGREVARQAMPKSLEPHLDDACLRPARPGNKQSSRASSLLVSSTQRSLALCAALRRAGQPASRFAARTARTGRRFTALCTWYVTVRAYVQVRRTVASVPLARRSSIHTNKASSLAVAGCSSDPARPAPRTLPCPARRVAWPSSLLTAGPPLRSSPPIL